MTVDSITDFTVWDLRDSFSDDEAAYLWLNLEPNYGNDHPGNVIGMKFALGEAEKRGELTNQTPYRPHPKVICIPRTTYSRRELKQYAERHKQQPPFLFPEYRHHLHEPESPEVSLSDAALGKQQRESLQTFAEHNQDFHNARQAEWIRWHTEGRRIQASRTRKCSNSELAKLIQKSLNLPDALSTIRQGLGKAEKLTCQN